MPFIEDNPTSPDVGMRPAPPRDADLFYPTSAPKAASADALARYRHLQAVDRLYAEHEAEVDRLTAEHEERMRRILSGEED